jgi:hypothetical protein
LARAERVEAGVEITSAHGDVIERQPGDQEQQRREGDHADRVPPLERFGEALGAPLLLLRIADDPHDPGQRALRGVLRDLDLENAGAVHRARENRVPDRLRDWLRLAGDRRLIDIGMAARDAAVNRHALARANDDALADQHILDADELLVTIAEDGGVLRGKGHQGAHGVAGAVHREVLERIRGGEERQQHAALTPGVDDRRANRGGDHQQVDVDGAGKEIRDRLLEGEGAAGQVGADVQGADHALRS